MKISTVCAVLALSVFPLAKAFAYSDAHNQATNLFRSSSEPTALDAVWTDKAVFKVGVVDDGSNRDGYAQYVCEVLADKGFKGAGVLVRVIDLAHLEKTEEWRNLGTAFCR